MTKYTTVTQPDPAKVEAWKPRRINPVEQWKFEAETKTHPADSTKGLSIGFIEYPDGARVMFTR